MIWLLLRKFEIKETESEKHLALIKIIKLLKYYA